MTLDEMKRAVAERLPEHIIIVTGDLFFWRERKGGLDKIKEVSDREWLHICHEAEKLLSLLWPVYYSHFVTESGAIINATYEKRLEALCRVWWPEKWEGGRP